MDDYEMEESVGSGHLDRLGELPESLIHHILSFLPIRDVVKTSLLSKRWEDLWTTLPSLDFSRIIIEDDNSGAYIEDRDIIIQDFVNRALMFWKGAKLLKFKIEIEDVRLDKSIAGDMDSWVRLAVLKKVEELDISWTFTYWVGNRGWKEAVDSNKDVYSPPQCLNSCSSIKKLSLSGCNLQIPGSVAWNQLKSLKIDGFYFPELLINQILLGAPRLQVFEFRFIDTEMNLNISSTSLKRLKIDKYLFIGYEPSLNTVLSICCPNLESLEISGLFYDVFLFTNVSSLNDVTLDLSDYKLTMTDWTKLLGERMRRIFSTLQHVERVALSLGSFEVIRASQKINLFSPLPNVEFLEVDVYLNELVEMVHLLGIFPNLKMLVIDDNTATRSPDTNAQIFSEFETNFSRTFLPQLKIIEITSIFYDVSILLLIYFLLKHCSMLEKLVIRTNWFVSRNKAPWSKIEEMVLSIPRSSPTAKVIFIRE